MYYKRCIFMDTCIYIPTYKKIVFIRGCEVRGIFFNLHAGFFLVSATIRGREGLVGPTTWSTRAGLVGLNGPIAGKGWNFYWIKVKKMRVWYLYLLFIYIYLKKYFYKYIYIFILQGAKIRAIF